MKKYSFIDLLKARAFVTSMNAETIVSNIVEDMNNKVENQLLKEKVSYISNISEIANIIRQDLERQKRVLAIAKKDDTFEMSEEQLTR